MIDKCIQTEKDRIFVDIAHFGCGSGCRYCYITLPNAAQDLLSNDEIIALSQKLVRVFTNR